MATAQALLTPPVPLIAALARQVPPTSRVCASCSRRAIKACAVSNRCRYGNLREYGLESKHFSFTADSGVSVHVVGVDHLALHSDIGVVPRHSPVVGGRSTNASISCIHEIDPINEEYCTFCLALALPCVCTPVACSPVCYLLGGSHLIILRR
jgi:hypothetical protein